ncbi:MAG: DNA polymerase IV [Bacteroidales bacterium]|nr:DNA polymerase IV [Bacteroidales bacterium]
MERTVLHLDLDTFFVSVERLLHPELEGKPVIVGGMGDRGVVSTASYEARRFGVHSAMPMRMAHQLCAQAVFIRGDMELYSRYSRLVTDIIADAAPVFEKMSIDEHYLDLTGMDRFNDCRLWAHELRQRIMHESGLPISWGLSENKTVAKIATGEAKPNGEKQVPTPYINSFLDPLPVQKIPMVGAKTYALLSSMGVERIGTLRRIPPQAMERVLGKHGIDIWKKANGHDSTPVCPYQERKSISKERTFEQDTIDVNAVRHCLARMVESLGYDLRQQHKLAGCVTLKLRYQDFDTHDMQQRIAYTAFDHVLRQTVNNLFDRLYNRRMRIRLVGVRLSELVSGASQLDLFDNNAELTNLYAAMDKIKNRFGENAIHHP